jgi:hypothetical protein
MKTLYIALCIGILAGLLSHGIVSAQTETVLHKFGGVITSDLTDFTFRFSVMVPKTPSLTTAASFANKAVVSRAKSDVVSSLNTEYYTLKNETYTTIDVIGYDRKQVIVPYTPQKYENDTKEVFPDGCFAIDDRNLECTENIPIYRDALKVRSVWEKFDMNKGLEPDVWYTFEVRSKKKANTGANMIDIIPSVMGYDLPYAWWNTSWTECRNITFNPYKITANLTNFEAVVVLDNSAGAFSAAKSDYSDVRFIDGACNMAGDELFFELEKYSAINATYHIKVNLTTPTAKKISVYYGNSVTNVSKSNPNAVWNGYSLVLHLNQTGIGSVFDSSPYHSLATTVNMEGGDVGRDGPIDGAFNMDGADEFVNVSDSTNLNFGDNMDFSWEAWAYPRGISGNTIIIKQKDASHNEGYYMRFDSATNYVRCGIDSTPFVEIADAVYHTNTWTYIVCAAKRDGNMTLFVNGNFIANSSITGIAAVNNTNSLFIGIGRDVLTYPMIGLIDEIKIYKGIKSPAWINATYINVMSPSAFYTLGPSETEYVPPIPPPNVTVSNISYTWDLGIELPIMQQYCSADGDSLITLRGRYAYSAIGELFFVNQTEVFTCPYGCSDNSLLTLGQTSACRESNFTIGLITIVAVLLIVGIIKVSGK